MGDVYLTEIETAVLSAFIIRGIQDDEKVIHALAILIEKLKKNQKSRAGVL